MRLGHLVQVAQTMEEELPLALGLHRVVGGVCFTIAVHLLREHCVEV